MTLFPVLSTKRRGPPCPYSTLLSKPGPVLPKFGTNDGNPQEMHIDYPVRRNNYELQSFLPTNHHTSPDYAYYSTMDSLSTEQKEWRQHSSGYSWRQHYQEQRHSSHLKVSNSCYGHGTSKRTSASVANSPQWGLDSAHLGLPNSHPPPPPPPSPPPPHCDTPVLRIPLVHGPTKANPSGTRQARQRSLPREIRPTGSDIGREKAIRSRATNLSVCTGQLAAHKQKAEHSTHPAAASEIQSVPVSVPQAPRWRSNEYNPPKHWMQTAALPFQKSDRDSESTPLMRADSFLVPRMRPSTRQAAEGRYRPLPSFISTGLTRHSPPGPEPTAMEAPRFDAHLSTPNFPAPSVVKHGLRHVVDVAEDVRNDRQPALPTSHPEIRLSMEHSPEPLERCPIAGKLSDPQCKRERTEPRIRENQVRRLLRMMSSSYNLTSVAELLEDSNAVRSLTTFLNTAAEAPSDSSDDSGVKGASGSLFSESGDSSRSSEIRTAEKRDASAAENGFNSVETGLEPGLKMNLEPAIHVLDPRYKNLVGADSRSTPSTRCSLSMSPERQDHIEDHFKDDDSATFERAAIQSTLRDISEEDRFIVHLGIVTLYKDQIKPQYMEVRHRLQELHASAFVERCFISICRLQPDRYRIVDKTNPLSGPPSDYTVNAAVLAQQPGVEQASSNLGNFIVYLKETPSWFQGWVDVRDLNNPYPPSVWIALYHHIIWSLSSGADEELNCGDVGAYPSRALLNPRPVSNLGSLLSSQSPKAASSRDFRRFGLDALVKSLNQSAGPIDSSQDVVGSPFRLNTCSITAAPNSTALTAANPGVKPMELKRLAAGLEARGGRYGWSKRLKAYGPAIFDRYTLGQVCHIVQLAVHLGLLCYENGGLLPPSCCGSVVRKIVAPSANGTASPLITLQGSLNQVAVVSAEFKGGSGVDESAAPKSLSPSAESGVPLGEAPVVTDLPTVLQCLSELLADEPRVSGSESLARPLLLSQLKFRFLHRFQKRLDPLIFGHARLSDFLAEKCSTVCHLIREGGRQVLVDRVARQSEPVTSTIDNTTRFSSTQLCESHRVRDGDLSLTGECLEKNRSAGERALVGLLSILSKCHRFHASLTYSFWQHLAADAPDLSLESPVEKQARWQKYFARMDAAKRGEAEPICVLLPANSKSSFAPSATFIDELFSSTLRPGAETCEYRRDTDGSWNMTSILVQPSSQQSAPPNSTARDLPTSKQGASLAPAFLGPTTVNNEPDVICMTRLFWFTRKPLIERQLRSVMPLSDIDRVALDEPLRAILPTSRPPEAARLPRPSKLRRHVSCHISLLRNLFFPQPCYD